MKRKVYPKKLSNRLDIKESRSEKNGMTSAMINARTQVAKRMLAQEAQPTTVWLDLCLVPSKSRKKTNLALTLAKYHVSRGKLQTEGLKSWFAGIKTRATNHIVHPGISLHSGLDD